MMRIGYSSPHTREYFEYRDEETVILTPGNISNIVMRRILIHLFLPHKVHCMNRIVCLPEGSAVEMMLGDSENLR
jgi:hypothetical protein